MTTRQGARNRPVTNYDYDLLGLIKEGLQGIWDSGLLAISPSHPVQRYFKEGRPPEGVNLTPEAREQWALNKQKDPEYQSLLETVNDPLMYVDPSQGLLGGVIKKVSGKAGGLLASTPKNPLIVQHNINTEALERVQRAGGMPMPSIAVSKAETPLTGFGDISLLGGPEMARPSAKNPVYAADAYTVRSPDVEIVPGQESLNLVKKFYGIDENYVAQDIAESILSGRDPYGSTTLENAFLKSRGKGINQKKYGTDNQGRRDFESAVKDAFRQEGYSEYIDWMGKQKNKLLKSGGDFTERIFKGFTNAGKRRYAPATLENIVKEMKVLQKERGATGMDLPGSLGSTRAKVTPQFRSLADVKKSRGKILTEEDFTIAKEKMEQKFADFQGQIDDYLKGIPEYSGGSYRTTEELTGDLLTGRSTKDWFPHDIPENLMLDARKFRDELRQMPTEYFEVKPKRGVELSEFQGAIIPQETSKTVKPILKEAGIKKILTYGTPEERKELFKRFPELMFSIPFLGAGLLDTETRQVER